MKSAGVFYVLRYAGQKTIKVIRKRTGFPYKILAEQNLTALLLFL